MTLATKECTVGLRCVWFYLFNCVGLEFVHRLRWVLLIIARLGHSFFLAANKLGVSWIVALPLEFN